MSPPRPAPCRSLPPQHTLQATHLPGLATRQIADYYPGEAKTDPQDPVVIADTARTMTHTLCSPEATVEITAELIEPVGLDKDLAAETTRTSNRTRGPLPRFRTSPHTPPAGHQTVTRLPEHYGPAADLRGVARRARTAKSVAGTTAVIRSRVRAVCDALSGSWIRNGRCGCGRA
ncbi:transposase, partial [Streptomyces sp. NPDC058394]|uniref:IS110 family transposase n=1 Tax=Streptomyces sp. NPDC058394 TaxID=3346477 RepID=UPI003647C79C